MPIGVLLALLAYSIYAIADSITKSFSNGLLSVFEISFFLNVFALVSIPWARSRGETWSGIFRLQHPLLMHMRAVLYVGSTLTFTYAVTHIPFAETYSLAFLAPLFLTFLSVVVLKEKVGIVRWVLVTLSFIGVLVVVRPGFRELGLGHLAAIGCALFGASANTILRVVAGRERQLSIIGVNAAYQLVVNGSLMLVAGFVIPDALDLVRLAIVGSIGGFAMLLIIRSMQLAPASHIGSTQYVQIVWAVALGAIFYHESQDLIGYAGLALLVLAGVATIFSDGAQARIAGRWIEFRARGNETDVDEVGGPQI